ncbi:MAG: hypothetical protein Q9220_007551 [cf. Caloplaca sp. 1 TL-2023]
MDDWLKQWSGNPNNKCNLQEPWSSCLGRIAGKSFDCSQIASNVKCLEPNPLDYVKDPAETFYTSYSIWFLNVYMTRLSDSNSDNIVGYLQGDVPWAKDPGLRAIDMVVVDFLKQIHEDVAIPAQKQVTDLVTKTLGDVSNANFILVAANGGLLHSTL